MLRPQIACRGNYVLFWSQRGNEEAGLFAREAAFLLLRHMYTAVPPADIKDKVLGGIGGNAVSVLAVLHCCGRAYNNRICKHRSPWGCIRHWDALPG